MFVHVATRAMVKITEHVQKRVSECTAKRQCLGCQVTFGSSQKVVRGCCVTCYTAINRAIARGSVSEREMIKQGKLLPATRGGRRPTNPMSQELASQ